MTQPALSPLIERAAAAYGIRSIDVRSARRSRSTIRARWAVAWAARIGTEYSYPRIAAALGGRDHTTIMHGIDRAVALREQDPEFRALCDELVMSLETGA